MKKLNLLQKIGIGLTALPFAVGIGLEGKVLAGCATTKPETKQVQAQEVKVEYSNPEIYKAPVLIGKPINSKEYVEDGIKYITELFDTADGGQAVRYRVGDKVFAYGIDHDKVDPGDYILVDTDGIKDKEGNQTFGQYGNYENIKIPSWVK